VEERVAEVAVSMRRPSLGAAVVANGARIEGGEVEGFHLSAAIHGVRVTGTADGSSNRFGRGIRVVIE